MIAYPDIDPEILRIGPIVLRWYSLAYIGGILLAWMMIGRMVQKTGDFLSKIELEDLIVWAAMGVIIGGRLGYVLFYNPSYYLLHPLQALYVWEGGMSFHGGAAGVILMLIFFAWKKKKPLLKISDMVVCTVPVGLFLGRLSNFINGELYGREAPDLPWGMVFPNAGPFPRHPSQLYEALLEGVVLFLLLNGFWRMKTVRKKAGIVSGLFLIGYALSRICVERVRAPDAHIGFFFGDMTMGMLLSVPMLLGGLGLIAYAIYRAKGSRADG